MSDNFKVTLSAQLATGAVTDMTKQASATGACTETFINQASIAGLAVDVIEGLGSLTLPKVVAVFGDEGISFKFGATGNLAVPADPVGAVSKSDGFATGSTLYVSNSSAQARTVFILAAE